MQVRVDWVLRIFGTQVIKKKRPVRPVFPDYLSVSYDYGKTDLATFMCRLAMQLSVFLFGDAKEITCMNYLNDTRR